MSMLAERKRKTKWVINPTKKPLWTTDSSGIKFGKELMEKMGWSAGKGLGSKEQGIQEPLRVSYKNDTKGMGFKGNDDDWIEHQDEFNVLLSQLRGNDDTSAVETSEKNEVKSLEDKSKHSRARVHYQKFTRGKDLSRYSKNDLDCILGIGKTKKQKSEPEETTKTEAGADGEYETSFGVTTINSGSIQDYFKKKLNFNKTKSNDSSSTTNDSFEYEKPVLQNNEYEEIEDKDKKQKKKKRKSEEDSSVCEVTEPCNEGLTSTNVDLSLTEQGVEERKAKKRKHKSKSEQMDTLTINENGEELKNCDVIEANNTEEIKIKKKKKKSKKNIDLDDNSEVMDNGKNECSFQQENFSEPPIENGSVEEKKSKKRKRNSEIEDEVTVLADESNDSPESGERKHKKKKWKSNSGSETKELIEPVEYPTNEKDCCNVNCENEIMRDQAEKKHKKKTKRIHNDESELLNDNHEAVVGNENEQKQNEDFTCDENLERTVKKHKKKKCKSKSEDEQVMSEISEIHNIDSHPAINDSEEIKEKHKKRKHKSESGTDTLDIEIIENVSEMMNNLESSKKPKKEKKRKERRDTSEKSDVDVSECIETVSEKALNDEEPESLPLETEKDIERKKRKKDKKNKKLEVVEGDDCLLEKVEKKEKKQKTKLEDLKLEECSTESTEKSNTCSDPIEGIVINETKLEKKKKEKKSKKKSENVDKSEEQISAAEAIVLEANASAKRMEKGQTPGKESEVKTFPPAVGASGVQRVNNSGKKATSGGNGKKPVAEPFQYKSYTTQKVLDLICWADIKEFRGSNLGNVLGYGFKREYLNKAKVS